MGDKFRSIFHRFGRHDTRQSYGSHTSSFSLFTLSLFIFSLFTLFVSSCTRRPAIYSYQPVNTSGWYSTDTLRYVMPELPHNGIYTLSLGARIGNRMPYNDLWLVLEQRYGADYRHRDTLHLELVKDERYANGNILHTRESKVTTAHYTTQQMPVEFLVYHIMRHQNLTGIYEIGLKVD